MSSARNFNTQPPPNYVAGLGRGATGFTTRSDIGPARMLPGGEATPGMPPPPPAKPPERKEELNEGKYDHFNGYEERLFGDTPYEEDDKLADEVWEQVDATLDKRRRAHREARMNEELAKYRKVRPKLQHQFADLKRDLEQVSYTEWESLPEPGAHIKGAQQAKRSEYFTKAPDSLLDRARSQLDSANSVVDAAARDGGGASSAAPSDTPLADLKSLGEARNSVLSVKLDLMSDSVTGQTVVDPKGYLTELSSIKVSSAAEIGDIKKARLLLDSVRTTNPQHAPAWIASARLEEVAGKPSRARSLMKEACETCADAEDVWLEAARLHGDENARVILADAVRKLPTSVKIWLTAASLEPEPRLRRLVLRKALELVPNSVKLWQAAIDLETPDDARLMLARAVECVPHSVDMWLALARLETYEKARKVLNKALEAVPTEPLVWVAAIKLEEANGHGERCDKLMGKALEWLAQHQVVPDRELWLGEAEAAERAGSPLTCHAIVKHTLAFGVEEEDRRRIWLEDADAFGARGSHECARAVFAACLAAFPTKRSVWEKAAAHEKAHGSADALQALLRRAVEFCPHAVSLWLLASSEARAAGDVQGARDVLTEAFRANSKSEAVWLAAAQLELDLAEHERARAVLAKARDGAGTEAIWARSVRLERSLGDERAALALASAGVRVHPHCAALHAAKAAVERALGEVDAARASYQRGQKLCPDAGELWIAAAQLEEAAGQPGKARTIVESARLRRAAEPLLWLEGVRIERRAGNAQAAAALMAKALQACPSAGVLWAEAIAMEPRQSQKAKSTDAIKRCDNDPHVVVAVARLFWRDRKVRARARGAGGRASDARARGAAARRARSRGARARVPPRPRRAPLRRPPHARQMDKARAWCNRAAALDPQLGDAWANYYAFECACGTAEQQADVLQRAVSAKPTHGEQWQKVADEPTNYALGADEVLRRVAAGMGITGPAPGAAGAGAGAGRTVAA